MFEGLDISADSGLTLVYTAQPGSTSADALSLLARAATEVLIGEELSTRP
jgi:hypothetical protein